MSNAPDTRIEFAPRGRATRRKRVRGWTLSLLVCIFFAAGPVQARKVISLPTVNSVEEALKLMDGFEGDADSFRVAIPEQLFDEAGRNAKIITDHALSRGWASDGFMEILSFRVYRYKEAVPASAAESAPLSGPQACSALMKRMGSHDGVPTADLEKTWFCDITEDDDNLHPQWWLIGLRSSRQCDGICSNLRGWFAVNRKSGEVREWDMENFTVGTPIAEP